MKGCFHTPPCATASVHHARRGHNARLAREAMGVLPPAARVSPLPAARELGASAMSIAACQASSATLRAAAGRPPWELSAKEFDAVSEPWFEAGATSGSPRMFGLSVSTLRFGLRLRLRLVGGPAEGYVADVPWSDSASLEDPRRAFVVEALEQGESVPPSVLADYPDLVD